MPKYKYVMCSFMIIVVLTIELAAIWPKKSISNMRLLMNSNIDDTLPENNRLNRHPLWILQFREREHKIFSQNGEDGVLLWIFSNIRTIHNPPYFVEFGVENGRECNTRFLRQQLGWEGLMMDGSNENHGINLHRETITAQNINNLLTKYAVPRIFDLLSIDINFDDYFVWKSILKADLFHPRVVVIEFNYVIPVHENRVVNPHNDSFRWTGTTHFGAGILALTALGKAHGYTLVYAEKQGINLFFIQTSILREQKLLHIVPPIEKLHVSSPDKFWAHRPETDKSRTWIWNDTIWK